MIMCQCVKYSQEMTCVKSNKYSVRKGDSAERAASRLIQVLVKSSNANDNLYKCGMSL